MPVTSPGAPSGRRSPPAPHHWTSPSPYASAPTGRRPDAPCPCGTGGSPAGLFPSRGCAEHAPSKLRNVTIPPEPIVSRPSPVHVAEKGSRLSHLLRIPDHKTIGLMYLTPSFTFFML